MNDELESILSDYYYGPSDVWDDYVKAVKEWARNERAEAWLEGHRAGRYYQGGCPMLGTRPEQTP